MVEQVVEIGDLIDVARVDVDLVDAAALRDAVQLRAVRRGGDAADVLRGLDDQLPRTVELDADEADLLEEGPADAVASAAGRDARGRGHAGDLGVLVEVDLGELDDVAVAEVELDDGVPVVVTLARDAGQRAVEPGEALEVEPVVLVTEQRQLARLEVEDEELRVLLVQIVDAQDEVAELAAAAARGDGADGAVAEVLAALADAVVLGDVRHAFAVEAAGADGRSAVAAVSAVSRIGSQQWHADAADDDRADELNKCAHSGRHGLPLDVVA